MPRGQEARQRRRLDRLDLAAERRERGAPQAAQHVGVAPLALAAAGAKLPADEQLLALELRQQACQVAPEACRRLGGRERAATLGKAKDELPKRLGASLEERLGQAARRHHPERVAITAGVVGGDQPLLTGDPHEQRSALGQ